MISGISKVEVGLITLTDTLILSRMSQKPNEIIVLLYIVFKKITTKTTLQET